VPNHTTDGSTPGILFIAVASWFRTLKIKGVVGAAPSARGSTPAPHPNLDDYRYIYPFTSFYCCFMTAALNFVEQNAIMFEKTCHH